METAPLLALNFANLTSECTGRLSRPVRPGKALVPEEVVDHRDLNRQPRSQQIIQSQQGTKHRQRRQLHADADAANSVELHPPKKGMFFAFLRAES